MEEFAFQDFQALGPAPAAVDALAPGLASPSADAVLDAVAQAQAEADAVREAAYAEGYEAGRHEALVAASGAAEALAEAIGEARSIGLERADALEHDAVELALALAEKIVGATLAVRPETVVDAVRTALRGIVERERIVVLVNPMDHEMVSEAVGGIQRELGGIEHVEVHAERRMRAGGAVVRHAQGEVDARLETKLERAREVVEQALGDAA